MLKLRFSKKNVISVFNAGQQILISNDEYVYDARYCDFNNINIYKPLKVAFEKLNVRSFSLKIQFSRKYLNSTNKCEENFLKILVQIGRQWQQTYVLDVIKKYVIIRNTQMIIVWEQLPNIPKLMQSF
eukprot:TRINITY_DN1327_c1_g1_i1.p7 TRINITY_DN1327_c1_g1~~TRINITY_DN1327_c1_g1_i1.p7  ORF type:complete len:128 (-),score=4.81 TRINITY_DN1327_c1_g1_i1:723-1106(-)